jgi:hypothetical protein
LNNNLFSNRSLPDAEILAVSQDVLEELHLLQVKILNKNKRKLIFII